MMKNNKGFMLIDEAMIVVAIVLIIGIIAVNVFANFDTQTRVVCVDTTTKETVVDEVIQGRVSIDEFSIKNYDGSYQKSIPYTYSCDAIVIKR